MKNPGRRTLAVVVALTALASVVRAADVSTMTVTSSTDTVSVSTPSAPTPPAPPAPVKKPEPPAPAEKPEPAPAVPSAADLTSRAVSALQGLASAYNDKRRSGFMRFVSDDYTGDLGTLEDALSSDFRSYRTIVLAVTPNQTTLSGLRTQVQFRFDMTVTDDTGASTKYAGQAVYTFVDENGKAKLLQMDRTPIFGTSLSSAENPVAKSQGAPTTVNSNGSATTAPGGSGCGTVITGSGLLDGESATGFNFASQSNTSNATADVSFFGGVNILSADGAAALADLGPCDINAFTQDPATISDSSDSATVGDCYAVRTNQTKYAVIKVTGFPASSMSFLYKYQTSGQRCF